MIHQNDLSIEDLQPLLVRLWEISGNKIRALAMTWPGQLGAPVVTVRGQYVPRGWTEWTEGFHHGSALLQFDATDDEEFLDLGRTATFSRMTPHVTHMGVHDHGFNIVSTFGTLWRLIQEGRIPAAAGDRRYIELALAASGAVQARRWTSLNDGQGFIHSFNGAHSLFVDTIRSLRSLAIAHELGHVLLSERGQRVSLLGRLIDHARVTDNCNVYHGRGRDSFDTAGRVAHESIFNVDTGQYVCPSTQQGYSPYTTWTRGLAWAMLGFAEQVEYLAGVADGDLDPFGGRAAVEGFMLQAALDTSDYYLANTPADGIPYWDTGAPGLQQLGDYLGRPADPSNDFEPVDSSAAAIAAQALLRLGHLLGTGESAAGARYWLSGLQIARTLLSEPYLSLDPGHQGLLLHSIYHRPNGWDYVPPWSSVPIGESSMWGDYHLRELALYIERIASQGPYLAFIPLASSAPGVAARPRGAAAT